MKRNFKLKFCKNCILPNTRPNLKIDKDGVCDPCKNKKTKINWKNGRNKFLKIVKKIKNKNKKNYDCLIPVSGGKDSTWQVLMALKYKMKPLCITWRSPARNEVGQKNLDNLIRLGVDHIDFSINPKIEKYFTLKTFKKFGNPLVAMHMALHALAVRIAIEKNIKLILWGENAADEYGGKKSLKGKYMTNEWRKYFGVNNNTTIDHWFDKFLNYKNTFPYEIPSQKEINRNKIKEVFLGHFFKWDPKKVFNISKKFGFKKLKKPKTGIYNFADIDDEFLITIHHYMKWYKFGFSRIWDNLSIEIRNGRMTRQNAIKTIKKIGNKHPKYEIEKFCEYVGITKTQFFKICDNLRNKKIWFKHKNKWKINNFLIKNWNWK